MKILLIPAVASFTMASLPCAAQEAIRFAPPPAGTVLAFNGVDYVFGGTHNGLTRLTLRYARQSTGVTLHLRDLFLTEFRRVRKQKAEFRITIAANLWPIRLGQRYAYRWTARIDGRANGQGRGVLRVFSGYEQMAVAGRRLKTVLIVKEQTWQNRRGDRFRSRQNLFFAPAIGFYVKEERFLFKNGRALPPIVLTLKAIRRTKGDR
jgi:hypothetical protein